MTKVRLLAIVLAVLLVPALASAEARTISRAANGTPTYVQGDFGSLDLGKALDNSTAQLILHDALRNHFGAVGNEVMEVIGTHTDKVGGKHIRFQQTYNGLPVFGAQMLMNADSRGRIHTINGEFVPSSLLPISPALDAAAAFEAAGIKVDPLALAAPTLTYVLAPASGEAFLAWQTTVEYENAAGPQQDLVFADAIGGKEIARVPQILYARSLLTYDCNNSTNNCNSLISSSSNPINTGDAAADAAHNFAIATYDYYLANHGRDSIDDNGMTLRSRVPYSNNYNNAFWNGVEMTYGDGDGSTFIALSRDADVVAHELTHGVTERSSNLIYANESGALNEALSDIFGAMVDRQEGATGADIWLLGEDIYTPNIPGDGLRDMAFPSSVGDFDYYPTRYTGSQDNGGVHWNSGIANLAFVLLVEGGTHPAGVTSNNVPSIGFDKAADIFYYANTSCLTASSNFQAARNCTAAGALALYGATEEAAVQEAWDAVGVPGGGGPPPPAGDCPAGYSEYNSSISAGDPDQVTATFTASGSFHGLLICDGADLDLYLDRMRSNGSVRNTVASSTSAGCNEEINYSNNRNRRYRWRVSAYSGSTSFKLCVDPG